MSYMSLNHVIPSHTAEIAHHTMSLHVMLLLCLQQKPQGTSNTDRQNPGSAERTPHSCSAAKPHPTHNSHSDSHEHEYVIAQVCLRAAKSVIIQEIQEPISIAVCIPWHQHYMLIAFGALLNCRTCSVCRAPFSCCRLDVPRGRYNSMAHTIQAINHAWSIHRAQLQTA
jgi:hypothetical protein